ncbi:hypothetical protein K491DRAFT_691447 [Lophiostoma macrostomum CBS 122681]|uniref:Uncharacterized protein n=1 Tax=Lophiostoma macrostomum CBS 122681 TaxID=1314788 RepID=A0A6A6TCM1_9PLEO|nr:hypothetical protein K491DRAFT_691447 [Lophiostoma macrostomum CBS 122681]
MHLLTLPLLLQAALAAPTAPKPWEPSAHLYDVSPPSPPQNTSSEPIIGPRSALWDYPHPASDELWEKAICKGSSLIDAIRKSDQEAASYFQPPPPGMTVQSEFKEFPRT